MTTYTIDDLRRFFSATNAKAFYAVVRHGESSNDDSAYTLINGGGHFSGFADHPYAGLSTRQGGRAAGAPQYLPSTWAEEKAKYGFPDFSPPYQDLGYVGRLIYRHALEDVLEGRFEAAVAKCRLEWTSLPGAAENNPKWNMEKARALYVEHGGMFYNQSAVFTDTQPAAPIEERVLPREESVMNNTPSVIDWSKVTQIGGAIASFFNPLVGAALTALSPLLQEKVTKEIGRHTDPTTAKTVASALSDTIMTAVKQATGKEDDFEAVAVLRKSPEAVAVVEQSLVTKLEELAPFIDKIAAIEERERAATIEAQNAAAERAKGEAWDMTRVLVYSAIGFVAVILLFFGAVALVQQATKGKIETEVWAALTGLGGTLVGILGTIFAYRFSSTQQSQAKNALIGAIALRK